MTDGRAVILGHHSQDMSDIYRRYIHTYTTGVYTNHLIFPYPVGLFLHYVPTQQHADITCRHGENFSTHVLRKS